jgi:tetratricopeptide (TPR) repeat protein
MQLARIASISAAIALFCLPALAQVPSGAPAEAPSGRQTQAQKPGPSVTAPEQSAVPPKHPLPQHAIPPQATMDPAALPAQVVPCLPAYVPCCVPCGPALVTMCYPAYPSQPAPVLYPPPDGLPYLGAARVPNGSPLFRGNPVGEGIEWLQQNEYEIAIKSFDEALRLEHKNAMAYYCRGEAWYRKGVAYIKSGGGDDYFERAANDYSAAIQLEPDFADAYSALGDAYLQLRRYELAIEKQNEALRRHAQPLAYESDTPVGPVGNQSAPAIQTDASQVRAYRGRAAAHLAMARSYGRRNDNVTMRQELQNAADDYQRASNLRLAGAGDLQSSIVGVRPESQSAH